MKDRLGKGKGGGRTLEPHKTCVKSLVTLDVLSMRTPGGVLTVPRS